MATNKPPTRLLTLPAELRNRIYDLALHSPNPVVLITTPSNITEEVHWNPPKTTFQPALTRACRQLRKETLPIFASTAVFKFELNHRRADDTLSFPIGDVKAWAGRNGRMLKYLRNLIVVAKPLQFPGLGDDADLPCEVTVQYVPGEGLKVEKTAGMNASMDGYSQDSSRAHKEVIEGYGERKGLEGEVVTLFFCAGRGEYGVLKGTKWGSRESNGVEGGKGGEEKSS